MLKLDTPGHVVTDTLNLGNFHRIDNNMAGQPPIFLDLSPAQLAGFIPLTAIIRFHLDSSAGAHYTVKVWAASKNNLNYLMVRVSQNIGYPPVSVHKIRAILLD